MSTISGAEDGNYSDNSEVDAFGDISPKSDHSDSAERRCRSSNPFPTRGENALSRAQSLPTTDDTSGSPKATITNEPDTVHEARHAVPLRKGPRDPQKKAKNEVKRGLDSYTPGPATVLPREIARRKQLRAKPLTTKSSARFPTFSYRTKVSRTQNGHSELGRKGRRVPNFDELYNSFSEPDVRVERALRLAYAQAKAQGQLPASYYTRSALDVVPESNASTASASGKFPAIGSEGASSAPLVVDSQRGSTARKRQRRYGNPAAGESRTPTNSGNVDNLSNSPGTGSHPGDGVVPSDTPHDNVEYPPYRELEEEVAQLRRELHERCDRHNGRILDAQERPRDEGSANERIEGRLASLESLVAEPQGRISILWRYSDLSCLSAIGLPTLLQEGIRLRVLVWLKHTNIEGTYRCAFAQIHG
ncbi:hypothetical protein PsorP6_018172 [Peronosclerospora sorghi]|uniref:Uncharacterized protein n=1 Tax=Peronosclerospora sorghi TaxID=230839 RepID=A0ACC0WEQ9_9STRA|nr:hypothetical protein PsorP6_018172 [Peronosclerospora sorghi]